MRKICLSKADLAKALEARNAPIPEKAKAKVRVKEKTHGRINMAIIDEVAIPSAMLDAQTPSVQNAAIIGRRLGNLPIQSMAQLTNQFVARQGLQTDNHRLQAAQQSAQQSERQSLQANRSQMLSNARESFSQSLLTNYVYSPLNASQGSAISPDGSGITLHGMQILQANSQEELDALPIGSMYMTSAGDVCVKTDGGIITVAHVDIEY